MACGRTRRRCGWSDHTDEKLYAYALSDGSRDADRDIDTPGAYPHERLAGVWSDGTTIWVAGVFRLPDHTVEPGKVFAYRLSDGARDAARDIDTLAASGSERIQGIWSDGTTMWVADATVDKAKVFAYNVPPEHSMPLFSADARLSDLSVAPRDIIGFDPARTTAYQVGVGPNVREATVIATANDAGASVSITGSADADPDTDGHQVSLSAGRNGLTVKVTAEDGTVVRNYEVRVNRGVTNLGGWHAGADFDGLIAAGNTNPRGVWSDGTTMWVPDGANEKVYAYRMSDGTHDAARDITLATVNNWPTGIWSDGTTMWVADFVADKVYAYALSGGARDADKDIDTLGAAGNRNPQGLWSDGTTMWVADGADAKVYAYALSGGARDADKDIDTLGAAGNGTPQGLWSDETTMWVADGTDDKVYAYALSGGARDADKDIDTLGAAGNRNPRGLWSDGTTMWVADYDNDKVYAYNLAAPPPPGEIVLSHPFVNVAGNGTIFSRVRLSKQPSADVEVTKPSSVDHIEVLGSPTMTFTPANWSLWRTRNLVGTPPATTNVAHTFTYTAASADPRFDGVQARQVVNLGCRQSAGLSPAPDQAEHGSGAGGAGLAR